MSDCSYAVMSNHKLTVANLCVSRVIQCELILPITAKFICVCTMYVQCMYNVYHGSWRDFTTAVGVMFAPK